MKNNISDQKWSDLKSKIKTKWSKFSDTDIEGLQNDFSQLPGRIQQVYGLDRADATRQYDDFRQQFQTGRSDVTNQSSQNYQRGTSPVADKDYDSDRNPATRADLGSAGQPTDEHVIASKKASQKSDASAKGVSGNRNTSKSKH